MLATALAEYFSININLKTAQLFVCIIIYHYLKYLQSEMIIKQNVVYLGEETWNFVT